MILTRSVAAFILLLLITRILGKQTLSHMTFHDFVTAVVIGAIAANLGFNEKIKHFHTIISLLVFTGTAYTLSHLAIKNRKLRKWISGTPTVLIENGKILETNMNNIKYTMDSLNQALREKDIFDIQEVEYALLEGNGKLSVMKKKAYRGLTQENLDRLKIENRFPVELVMDGNIVNENIGEYYKLKIEDELRSRGKSIGDVFYAVRGTNGQLFIDYYQDHLQNPIDNE